MVARALPALALTGVLTVSLLTGCSTQGAVAGPAADPRPLLSAPEPARAPAPTAAPAGRVQTLGGGRPEGMVADPVSGLIAIGLRSPDRVALVDPKTGQVRTSLVYGSARHLELAGGVSGAGGGGRGGLIVPGEDSDLVTTYDLPSMQARSVVKVGRQPHDVAVTQDGTQDGTLYVADEFGGSVSVVRFGRVVKTFRGLLQPGGAAGNGEIGAVVDVRSRLTHFYRGDRQIARLASGAGPTHALSLGGAGFLVTDTTGGKLYRYSAPQLVSTEPESSASAPQTSSSAPQGGDPAAPRQLEVFDLPGRPYGTAYDTRRRRIFITATERNELVQLSVTPTGLKVEHRYPTVRDAYSVAVDSASGRVFVTSESESTLQILDPLP